MVIDHTKPAPDGKIVVAEDIRALQAKEQDHLCRPDADSFEAAERPDRVLVVHARYLVQAERACVDLFGKIRDIFCLTERHTKRLQCRNACFQNGFGVDAAKRIVYSLPDGCLRFRGDLLANDVVNNG